MIRRVVAIVIAVVLAVVGTVLVLGYVKTADARAIAGKQAVQVLVAKERIPAGTSVAKIRANDLVEKVTMPASTVPASAIGGFEKSADDLVVTAEVQASQLLLRGMFSEKVKSTGGLSIPKGKIAVSVQLETPEQVAGFVRPGTTIAIFNTFNMIDRTHRESNGEGLRLKDGVNQATKMLLPKVEVIAVGAYGTPGTKTSDGKTTKATAENKQKASQLGLLVVTVAVTQAEAERLVHALRTSSLYLALVTDDSDVKPGAGVDNHSLFK
ncbi:MAG: Flp pilus assembly protein CpaB [Micromonosporaceae bacterium]